MAIQERMELEAQEYDERMKKFKAQQERRERAERLAKAAGAAKWFTGMPEQEAPRGGLRESLLAAERLTKQGDERWRKD